MQWLGLYKSQLSTEFDMKHVWFDHAISGRIYCWGHDANGAVKYPTSDWFYQVSAGEKHTCGLRRDKSLYCFGDAITPLNETPEGNDFNHVTSGSHYSCAIRESGAMECWGRHTTTQSTTRRDFRYVAAGDSMTCAITIRDAVRCFNNRDGR